MKVFPQYKILSDGSCMAMYITRYRRGFSNFVMIIALCIFENKTRCDEWFKTQDKPQKSSVKSIGLEGVMLAIRWIKKLQEQIQRNDILVIYWTDERRRKAFRYLKRYGFVESVYKKRPCYLYKKVDF